MIFDNSRQSNMLVVKSINASNTEAANTPNPVALIPNLWNEGELACLFAKTNLGKSIYAVQISAEIAKTRNVLYFDCEISDKQFQLRYTNPETGEIHQFPDSLFRATISTNAPFSENYLDMLLDEIRLAAINTESRVIIIDNLSYVCMRTEKADEAGMFMAKLKQLQSVFKFSILVVAHSPKISGNVPVELNHLAGSSRLSYFFDDIFAIGKSTLGKGHCYIKQLKYRAGEFTYTEENVKLLELVKQKDGNLIFEDRGSGHEQSQISSSYVDQEKIATVIALREQGMSYREIQARTGISKSAAGRMGKGTDCLTISGQSDPVS